MNKPQTESSLKSFQRLVIFTAFTAGLIISRYYFPAGFCEDRLIRNLLLTSLPMAAALISSSSVLGFLLLPLSSFLFGSVSMKHAELLIGKYTAGSADMEGFLIFIISVPVFFVVSVKGMEASRILMKTMNSGSSSSRNAYEREYIPMTLAVMAALAAVCLISG